MTPGQVFLRSFRYIYEMFEITQMILHCNKCIITILEVYKLWNEYELHRLNERTKQTALFYFSYWVRILFLFEHICVYAINSF